VSAIDAVALGACAASLVPADLRWLRVAQREHYLPGAASRFGRRWWLQTPLNSALGVVALGAAVAATVLRPTAFATALVAALAPVGLGLRGRTSRLAWTRRLGLVAALSAFLEGLVIVLVAVLAGLGVAVVVSAFCALAAPLFVDTSLFVLRPFEDLFAERYVREARTVLARVEPVVVAITGSYGKTTTKNYVSYLLAGDRSVVASPRSFNNRAGLTRTVNEHLALGTEVLVAEMGAYGPGEIAALCSWLRPDIAVITSIGPAHLERFGTLERTLEAKAEITARARVAVLNVDDSRLYELAGRLEATHKVLRASGSDREADVAVLADGDGLELYLAGRLVEKVSLPEAAFAPIRTNAACAAAVAIELGVAAEKVAVRLGSLPAVPNRLQPYRAAGGYLVLDDTFNSNPTGARHALEVLAAAAPSGRRVLVTPGMVELGRTQGEENAALAEAAGAVATDLVVVGRTNQAALVRGWRRVGSLPAARLVAQREAAVDWARAELGPGDAVLFENDLPDHFP
jgi:UDP-N-acetylmuramoyl-tripeptide--D-alanyl-D-alanine ligase